MLTKEQAISADHGATFHHKWEKNSDGTPVRCRKNGQCKTWKREPEKFRLPVKYGLRDCFYISERNAEEWSES